MVHVSQPQNPEFRNNPENFHPCKTEKTKQIKRALGHWVAHLRMTVYKIK